MDSRGREAIKRYRNSTDKDGYDTVSLTLSYYLISFLEEKIKEESDRNMSRFVEEHVSKFMPKFKEPIPKRRPYGTKPDKKTFTFTKAFVSSVKKRGGGMSFFIETILAKEFSLSLEKKETINNPDEGETLPVKNKK